MPIHRPAPARPAPARMTPAFRGPLRLRVACLLVAGAVAGGSILPASAWSAGQLLIGIYYGNEGWKLDQVRALDAWTGNRRFRPEFALAGSGHDHGSGAGVRS